MIKYTTMYTRYNIKVNRYFHKIFKVLINVNKLMFEIFMSIGKTNKFSS